MKKNKNILQAIILNLNDGLFSTFGLILGMVAVAASRESIIAVGIFGIISSAVSMSAAQFEEVDSLDTSTKSNALMSALWAFCVYIICAIVPLFPFFFVNGWEAVIISGILFFNILFDAGLINHGKRKPFKSASRQVIIGIIVVLLTYGINLFMNYVFGINVIG